MLTILENDSLLIECLSYNPETGLFIWKKPISRKLKSGHQAGSKNTRGYIVISCAGKFYLAHRLAWFLYYLEWPNGNIDHINHDMSDNRICNLRVVNQNINLKNQSIRSNNSSGIVGVWFSKRRDAWMAEIMVEYKKITLGQYKDIAFAVTIRKIAERFYGFHENHGKNIGDIQAANQGLILESKGEFAKNQRKENS